MRHPGALFVVFVLANAAYPQVMQRRSALPSAAAPAVTAAPAATTAPAATSAPAATPAQVAAQAPDPNVCVVDYTSPPIITSIEPLFDKLWQDNTIVPAALDPANPEAYTYAFVIRGCHLKSADVSHRELIGFDTGHGLTLVDAGQDTDVFHSYTTAIYVAPPIVQDALRAIKVRVGPASIVIETPNGRTVTDPIYYIAPPPRKTSASTWRAPAINVECIRNSSVQLLAINGRKGATQFSNLGQWKLTGCNFGAGGKVDLIARNGTRIATRVVSWSQQAIEIATQDLSGATASQSEISVNIEIPQLPAFRSPYIHSYNVFKPMPEGYSNSP